MNFFTSIFFSRNGVQLRQIKIAEVARGRTRKKRLFFDFFLRRLLMSEWRWLARGQRRRSGRRSSQTRGTERSSRWNPRARVTRIRAPRRDMRNRPTPKAWDLRKKNNNARISLVRLPKRRKKEKKTQKWTGKMFRKRASTRVGRGSMTFQRTGRRPIKPLKVAIRFVCVTLALFFIFRSAEANFYIAANDSPIRADSRFISNDFHFSCDLCWLC